MEQTQNKPLTESSLADTNTASTAGACLLSFFSNDSNFLGRISIDPSTGCWNWLGAIGKKYNGNSGGYGFIRRDGKQHNVHRWAFQKVYGKLFSHIDVDHLCRNRACCNPLHCEAVTRKVNILRGVSFAAVNAKKTTCPKGHFYTAENTRSRRHKRGYVYRECAACKRERNKLRTRPHS